MDWDNVKVFLAVARAGQVVGAAKRLKLDHATVAGASRRWKPISARGCSIGAPPARG